MTEYRNIAICTLKMYLWKLERCNRSLWNWRCDWTCRKRRQNFKMARYLRVWNKTN